MSQPFLLGVNYWPRRKAMYWWRDFDAGEVREEFAIIRDIGMHTVRIFLFWDDWQPAPDVVSADCMRHLEVVADTAAANGLKLDVTFFTGHMSGPNWPPEWLLDRSTRARWPLKCVVKGQEVDHWYRSFFTDPVALDAQRLLLRTVVGAFHQHPALWMWNLGNEPDLFAIAPDRATGRQWVESMTAEIRALDDVHVITTGLHSASLLTSDALRCDDTFAIGDIGVMHAYPMYIDWVENPLDPWFVPYTCAMTAMLGGKPVLAEEFGGCTVPDGGGSTVWAWESYGAPRTQFMASEADFADYIAAILPNLQQTGALGAMLWCFADYAPELWDRPPLVHSKHERFFGLVRPDGTLKPHTDVIRRFSQTQPTVQPAPDLSALRMTPDDFYADPAYHLQRLYPAFLQTVGAK
jgi:endo-1,4-beta-mannosidase